MKTIELNDDNTGNNRKCSIVKNYLPDFHNYGEGNIPEDFRENTAKLLFLSPHFTKNSSFCAKLSAYIPVCP